jgi:hypothetical protein
MIPCHLSIWIPVLLAGAAPTAERPALRPIELTIAEGRYVGQFEIEALESPVELTIEDRGGLPSDEKLPKPKKDEPTPTRPRFQPVPNTPEHEMLVEFNHAPLSDEERTRPALPPWLESRSTPSPKPAPLIYRYPITSLPPRQAVLFSHQDQILLILLGPEHVFLAAYRFSAASGRFHPTELSDQEKAALGGSSAAAAPAPAAADPG